MNKQWIFKNGHSFIAVVLALSILAGCKENDPKVPEPENEEEVITSVKLIFTSEDNESDVVTARAEDPDGTGIQELEILDEISLDTNQTYNLSFEIMNPNEDIGREIEEESDEHQFFFSFSPNAFSDPGGNGNIDNASDPINYNDRDKNGNPVGLSTTWTTGTNILEDGFFTVRLQHQPDIKSSDTGADEGDTDIHLTFELNIL